jgi:hypothetical protein
MPRLRDPRLEVFARELAASFSAVQAGQTAGYPAARNPKTFAANCRKRAQRKDIRARVAELQEIGAALASVSAGSLIVEAEHARIKAMCEKSGAAAAVSAITCKAKLAGLWRDKVALTDPSGEHAPHYIISERPMTEAEWEAQCASAD